MSRSAALFDGGRVATIVSAFALLFSAYSLWETSLKQSDLRVFVPPVIQYAAPYQNSNFEALAIPVTIANEGARTGTVLAMNLQVFDPRTNQTKNFYSADFGRWTMERTRSGAYEPFAPISLAGRTSLTRVVLFYTRGQEEKVQQLIREPGPYRFTLTLDEAVSDDFGLLDRLWSRGATALTFERDLLLYDARVFNTGTLQMTAKDRRSTASGEGK